MKADNLTFQEQGNAQDILDSLPTIRREIWIRFLQFQEKFSK